MAQLQWVEPTGDTPGQHHSREVDDAAAYFAAARMLEDGDALSVIIDGRHEVIRVCDAFAPEAIVAIPVRAPWQGLRAPDATPPMAVTEVGSVTVADLIEALNGCHPDNEVRIAIVRDRRIAAVQAGPALVEVPAGHGGTVYLGQGAILGGLPDDIGDQLAF